MTVNFQQHERELLAAFDKVATSKTCDDWVIFEYEGNSNVLRVGEQGDYGVDEFASSFNAGRLQYGVAAVKSQAISQPKIVLVHWQGESVPATRLASTTSHVNDVKRFLKGVHVVLYARSELDVDSATITSAVEKLPGMKDNKAEASYAQPAPVSSVYTPVKPNRDAGLAARDEFWKQEKEREEAEQREQEQRRRDDAVARTPSPAKAPSPVPVQPAPVAPPPAAAPSEPTQRIAANRRAMFEQMSAGAPPPMPKPAAKTSKWTVNGAGSFNGKAPSVIEPVKSTPPAPVTSQPARFPAPAPGSAPAPAPILTPVAPPPAPAPSTPAPSAPASSAPPAMVPPPAPAAVSSYYEVPPMEEIAPPPVPQYEEPPCVDVMGEGLRAVALWDYQAEDASEISFDPDEVISEIEQVDAGWWRGRAPNGHVGLFPANYVTLLQ